MRALLPAALALAAALAVGVGTTASAAPVPIRATLTTSSTSPQVGEPWRYTVVVRRGSRRTTERSLVRLQILLGQTVVGCWRDGRMAECVSGSPGDWIAFRGRRTGVLRWPAQSVGVRLTFQVVVKAGGRTLRLRAPLVVKPA